MRKLILFWFLLGLQWLLQGQNGQVAIHNYRDDPKHVVSIHSKCYYLDQGLLRLVGLNQAGIVNFSTSLPGHYVNTIHRLIKTNDNCLAAIGTGTYCHTSAVPNRNYIVKIDTTGAVLFQTLIQFTINAYPYLDFIVDFVQHQDSSFYIVSDSYLYHYSKNGIFLSKINSGLSGISAMTALNNGNFLLSGKLNNIQSNLELTTTASIVAQQSASYIIKKYIQNPSGNIYALTSSSVILQLDSSYNTANITSNTIGTNFSITDFCTRGDSLFITGFNNTTKTPVYFLTGQALNILYQTPTSTYKNIFPSCIAIDGENMVNIICRGIPTSASPYFPGPLSFMSRYRFALNGDFVSKYDIGVQSYTLVSNIYDTQSSTGSCNFDVTVKNHTSDTIKNFWLNYNGFTTFTCLHVFLHKYYNTLILPYGSVNINTGNFYYEKVNLSKICIFTTVPNSSTDIDVENDTFCDFTLGIMAQNNSHNQISVFPNPFINNLYIHSNSVNIKKIAIFNTTGHVVKEISVNDKDICFDNNDLASGIYLLKIETERGLQIKKIIKE